MSASSWGYREGNLEGSDSERKKCVDYMSLGLGENCVWERAGGAKWCCVDLNIWTICM